MSSRWRRRAILFAVIGLACFFGKNSNAMREIGGKDPIGEGPWPDGCVAVANLPTRLAYSAGDGAYLEFVYRGDTDAFQKALTAFAAIRAPVLELDILDGPHDVDWVQAENEGKTKDRHVDWTFTFYEIEEWHNIFNNPNSNYAGHQHPVPAPRISVYVEAPGVAGRVDWTRVTVPEGVHVKDQRASARKTKPAAGPAMTRGVIYDLATGKTIPGATITVMQAGQGKWQKGSSVTADATGRYQIEPPAGSHLLVAEAKGYAARILDRGGYTPEMPLQIDCELSEQVTIKGTVTDDQDKPLAGIVVRLEGNLGIDGRAYDMLDQAEAKTDESGHFTMTGAPTGYAQFHCDGAGYSMLNPNTRWKLASWKVISDDGQNVKKTGEVPVALRMAVPGRIRCKVVSTDGKPLIGDWDATIADAEGGYSSGRFSHQYQRTVHVLTDGTAEFSDVPVGRYYVVVGYWIDTAKDVKIVTVLAGQTVDTSVSVKPRPVRPPPDEPKPIKPPKPATDDRF